MAGSKDDTWNSTARVYRLLDINPDATFVSRIDNFLFVDVNERACETYGYSREEFLQMQIFDIEVVAPLEEEIRRLYDASGIGEVIEIEGRNQRKDGTTFPVHVRFCKLDEEFAVANVRDISQLHQTNADVRRYQHQIEQLLARRAKELEYNHELVTHLLKKEGEKGSDHSNTELPGSHSIPGAIWRTREVGRTSVDFLTAEMIALGFTAKCIESGAWIDLIHPDDKERIATSWAEAFRNRQPFTAEFQILDKKGEAKWVLSQASPTVGSSGEFDGYIGNLTDISDIKRSQKDADDWAARTQDIFHHSAEGIVIIDEAGTIESFNPSAARIFGYTSDEAIGNDVGILMASSQLLEHNSSFEKYLASGDSGILGKSPREVVGRTKSGKEIPLDLAIGESISGGRRTFIGSFREIEDRKMLQEQLYQAQKMEAIGTLAGGIAHDFNNLLTVINGYSEIRLDNLDPEDPLFHDLNEIKKAGDKAAALTRQLLAFGRKQILKPKVIDLQQIAQGMANMLSRLIGEHIRLEMRSHSILCKVKADPGQIEQVIMNLVINARDAMPQGGSILIDFANLDIDEQTGRSMDHLKAGEYVMLSITDTGAGMDESVRSRVFEPFFTTKESEKGTGLGLSTVFGIVKQSGGTITVESEPGEGSSFRVYLPSTDDDASPRTQSRAPRTSLEGDETVLVVEDEDLIRNLLKRILEALGYKVLVAAHGGEALLVVEDYDQRIDLMITDVIMPHMSGHELVERLMPDCPGMQVLYISGYDEEMLAHHGLVDQDRQFVHKPFGSSEIALKVRQILDDPIGVE